MAEEYTKQTFLQAYHEFLDVCGEYGLPEEVSKEIAKQLHSERGLRRMISYFRNAHPRSMEDIADEMIAIIEDTQRWREKKLIEESNARYNAWLNSDMRQQEDE